MATWTPQSRNSATFTPSSRNTSVFTNASKSLRMYGDLTNDEIGGYSNDDIFQGRPIGDWANDDFITTVWANQTRS